MLSLSKGSITRYIFPFFLQSLLAHTRKNAGLALLSTLAAWSGMCSGQLHAATATLTVSTTTIAFGNVNIGQTAIQSVTLSSTGTAPVTVSSISVAGSLFSATGVSTPLTLNPGQTAKLTASFSPLAANPWNYTGLITIASNSSTNPSLAISMSGAGIAMTPTLIVSATTIAFGNVNVGQTATQSVTLSSTGTAPVTISSISVAGSLFGATGVSTPLTLNPGQTAKLTASFGPLVANPWNYTGLITITSNSSTNPSLTISMSGAGIATTPTLIVSATTIAFGNVNVGQTATQSVTLSSTGTAPVTISSISVAGSLFGATGVSTPLTLNPGQTATLTASFSPLVANPWNYTGLITIASNSSTNPSSAINMSGAGIAVPTLKALSCGTSSYTGAGTDACTVSLTAAAPGGGQIVSLSSSNPAVIVPATVSVPSGATSAGFSATVSSVTSAQSVTLTATSGAVAQSFAIQLSAMTPTLGISSSSASFGSVALNTTVSQSLTLTSAGTGPVIISSAGISGAGFTLSGITFPTTLNPGQTATLNIQFDPTTSGAATGQISIASNSSTGTSTIITLGGAGLAALKSLSCGNASMTGAGTDACTVTLNGGAPAGGMVINLASNNAAVTVPATVTVPANAASAVFSATVTAVATAQAVSITASAGSASQNFALELNAAVATLSLSTSSINYGNVNIGATATAPVILTSTGNVPVVISGVSVAGSLFGATGILTPLTLNPGQTATLSASFSPLVANPWNYTGAITISSNSSSNPSAVVNMSGAGVAPSALSAISCGTASYTAAGTDACTVSLTGAAPSGGFTVALSSNNSAVTLPASVTVASGATSAAFSVSVSTVTSSQSATITATAAGVSQIFAIQLGNGVGSLSINATSVPFGAVVVNSTAAQSITLTASGTSPVTLSAASITAVGFTVSGATFPLTLNPGQTATLNIEFAPLTTGSFTGQLTISSNCAGGNIAVGLSGTSEPHEVQLSWGLPSGSTDPVVGYNIYRTVAGSSDYVLVNAAEDSQTTYTDTTVMHATSYVYYVMSVDSSGVQSSASNTIALTIP